MNIDEAKSYIKEQPISHVISYYMPLNKRGQNYEGICPFHQDTKPSLKVNDQKNLFKCFACGAAGDHISFVEKFKNYDFIAAIEDIASHVGINIEKQNKKQDPQTEMALRVLQAANRVYRKMAIEHKAIEFEEFVKARKLSDVTVKKFSIGYAPHNSLFSQYLETIPPSEKEFAIEIALKIGLVRRDNSSGGLYDTFRDRIIFPIWDHSGQVRGFGSRATKDFQKAKYLNSQESFVFNKRMILYGFNLARNEVRAKNTVIITEGYMDCISLHQNGIDNAVALMGIAISDKNIKTLKSTCENIYLSLDSDDAGFQAMKRINADFMKEGILAKYLNFHPHKDPDDYIINEGQLKFRQLMEKATPFVDTIVEQLLPEKMPELAEQKLDILKNVFAVLSPLGSDLRALERVVNTANRLKLQTSSEEIILAYKQTLTGQVSPKRVEVKLEKQSEEKSEIQQRTEQVQLSQCEKIILKQMICHPECLNHPQITEILDFVSNSEVKRLIAQISNIYLEIDESEYLSILQNTILVSEYKVEIKEFVSSVLFQYRSQKLDNNKVDKLMVDLLKKIKIESLKSQRNLLKSKQIKSQTQDESGAYLLEIQQIEKQLSELKNAASLR